MKRCMRCNVTVMDETNICPLCHGVLKKDAFEPPFTGYMYPDLREQNHVARLVQNITLFVSILTVTMLFAIFKLRDAENYLIPWVVTILLVYINSLLRLSILGKSSHTLKVISGTIFTLAVLWGVDFLTGNHGWAMAIVYPIAVILLDLAIMILMIVNRRSWQSYMMLQLFAVLLSLLPMICLLLEIFHYRVFAWASFGIAVFFFLGTYIIGDHRARNEMKRRFHI